MTKDLVAKIAAAAAVLFLTCNTVSGQPATDSGGADAGHGTFKLAGVILSLPAGAPYLHVRTGLICLRDNAIQRYPGGRAAQNLPPYAAVFQTEMEKAGFKTVADDNLFNREDEPAGDYQVAAVISDATVTACVSSGGLLSSGLPGDAKGDSTVKVDWQIYSPVRKEVVARVSTSGTGHLDQTVSDGVLQLMLNAFADNTRALIASPAFRTALSAKPVTPQDILHADQQSKITLLGSSNAAKRPIADTVGSVVTLTTGDGSGSGVLLSDDGYILTDAHVVGEEKELRVRWSDGIEKVGEVIRVSKARDVALVKTDPRGRSPVPIHKGPLMPGQRVFAIGSPTGKAFQGTVSSGVISAMRTTTNGMNYIQSDVMVSHGSSGGALLDESGSLLGLTDLGFTDQGQVAGLNLFTPIGDAMDFLNLEQN